MARKLNEANEMDEAMPLDYTFKKLEVLTDGQSEKPREDRVGKTPKRGPNNKFLTKAIWLNNNELTSITGIDIFADSLLQAPELLGWIDFAFNQIKLIDPAILKFQNLTILYFHGNEIEDINTVLILKDLPKLKRLTLHGNPVTDTTGYRGTLLHFIPQLQNLDFSPILKRERAFPPPAGTFKRKAE